MRGLRPFSLLIAAPNKVSAVRAATQSAMLACSAPEYRQFDF
jgi:hypothetical protein